MSRQLPEALGDVADLLTRIGWPERADWFRLQSETLTALAAPPFSVALPDPGRPYNAEDMLVILRTAPPQRNRGH